MKKNLGLVFAALMILMVLVSCGSKKSPFAGMSFYDEIGMVVLSFTDNQITVKIPVEIYGIFNYSVDTKAKTFSMTLYKVAMDIDGDGEQELATIAEVEKAMKDAGMLDDPTAKKDWDEMKATQKGSYKFDGKKLTLITNGVEAVLTKI